MLAASAYPYPFPPSHPQPGYQPNKNAIPISDADHQRDLQRKRTYLSLLPPAQLIEICLNFGQYVPLHIQPTVWPADLDAAIQALQKTSQQPDPPKDDAAPQQQSSSPPAETTSTPTSDANVASQQVHPPGVEPPVQVVEASGTTPASSTEKSSSPRAIPPPIIAHSPDQPLMPSLPILAQPQAQSSQPSLEQSAAPAETSSTPPLEAAPAMKAQAPPVPQAQIPVPQATVTAQAHTSTSQTPAQAPAAQAPGQAPTPTPLTPYPYAPYGYPLLQQPYPPGAAPQAGYPHAPYYPPPGAPSTGYTSHYPGYPPYPPPAHPYSLNPPQHAHQPPPSAQSQSDDLPSYEDMIVEALSEIGDPDGAAPKDIFTWIGARWPLQMNFRPSASQALQKAFKRGRLEKRSGGRYRLNPAWEGGATSKRTTRRPQTLAQTTYALHHSPQQNASPFTHAPLPHRAHTSPPPAPPPQHQPYPGYAYPYPSYGGYPGFPHLGQPAPGQTVAKTTMAAFKTTLQSKTANKTIPSGKEKDSTSNEASDAWEAAQHILQAINFGSLQNNTSQPAASSLNATSNGVPPPPVMASLDLSTNLGASSSNAVSPPIAVGEDGLGRATLTDEERASLQAQLALLAAQLSEMAHEEEEEEPVSSQSTAATTPVPVEHPQPQAQARLPPQPPPQQSPQQPQRHIHPPPIIAQSSSMHAVLMDINHFPDHNPATFVSILRAQTRSQPPSKPAAPPQPAVQQSQPQPQPQLQLIIPQPTPQSQPQPQSQLQPLPVTLQPPSEPTLQPQAEEVVPPTLPGEESDEDEDMEMVDVDSYMQGLQT